MLKTMLHRIWGDDIPLKERDRPFELFSRPPAPSHEPPEIGNTDGRSSNNRHLRGPPASAPHAGPGGGFQSWDAAVHPVSCLPNLLMEGPWTNEICASSKSLLDAAIHQPLRGFSTCYHCLPFILAHIRNGMGMNC